MLNRDTTDGSLPEDFESLAFPYLNDLFQTASSLLPSQAEALDTVHEAYVNAWESFARVAPSGNCRVWLFRFLFASLSKHFRGSAIFGASSDQEVLSALQNLPRPCAEVLILADAQDFTYREIQETLSIPLGLVMSRLSEGRRLLRERLAESAHVARFPAKRETAVLSG